MGVSTKYLHDDELMYPHKIIFFLPVRCRHPLRRSGSILFLSFLAIFTPNIFLFQELCL